MKISSASKYSLYIVIITSFLFVTLVYFTFLRSRSPLPHPTSKSEAAQKQYDLTLANNNKKYGHIQIPKIIHQMWKDHQLPADLIRWTNGCKQVNSDFEFRFYTDIELKSWVNTMYPEYYDFFCSLKKGVYMADMARVLITYHYGGKCVSIY